MLDTYNEKIYMYIKGNAFQQENGKNEHSSYVDINKSVVLNLISTFSKHQRR